MIVYVELDRILPNPWQTRGEPSQEHIQALAEDIEKNGLLQTPVGRKDGEQIQLAFGHNRLAAFKLLAARGETLENGNVSPWLRLPVDLLVLSDEQMAQFAWSENERRRDLTPIERARAIQKRMEDFDWTHEQAAQRLELSRTTVSNILRLLELPKNLQEALGSGDLSERSAMALLPLYDVPEEIRRGRFLYTWGGPEKIVEEALDGSSSEAIRKKVNDYFARNFTALDQKSVALDEQFPEGGKIYCGMCRTCDKRLAARNLCLDEICYEAKLQIVRHHYLEKASLASGYGIIDEDKGGYPSTLPIGPERLERILATKCQNLRLAYDLSGVDPKDPRRIPGHPKALLVCDKRNDSCSCLKGLDKMGSPVSPVVDRAFAEEVVSVKQMDDALEQGAQLQVTPSGIYRTPPPTPAELEAVMRQARQDKKDAISKLPEVRDLLVDLLARALAEDHPGAFYAVINQYGWPIGDLKIQDLYREGARNAAKVILPQNCDSVDELVRMVNAKLERLGLPAISLEKTLVDVFAEAEAE